MVLEALFVYFRFFDLVEFFCWFLFKVFVLVFV